MEITIEQVSQITGIRVEVLNFALLMEEKLKKNDHKGGWENCDNNYLMGSLEAEVYELSCAIDSNNIFLQKECADVANYAMMIADNSNRKKLINLEL